MLCRISLLLGRPPSEVMALPVSDMNLLTAYWQDEPWGPWRDNLHAGLIASAVANYGPKKLRRVMSWKDFLLKPRIATQTQNRGSLLAALRMMAKPRQKGAKVKPRD